MRSLVFSENLRNGKNESTSSLSLLLSIEHLTDEHVSWAVNCFSNFNLIFLLLSAMTAAHRVFIIVLYGLGIVGLVIKIEIYLLSCRLFVTLHFVSNKPELRTREWDLLSFSKDNQTTAWRDIFYTIFYSSIRYLWKQYLAYVAFFN